MIALLLALVGVTAARLPVDVRQFIHRRDSCDHWRGEEAYDADRARAIERAIARDCTGTDDALGRLKRRHAHEPAVRAALAPYERTIESHSARSTWRKRPG